MASFLRREPRGQGAKGNDGTAIPLMRAHLEVECAAP